LFKRLAKTQTSQVKNHVGAKTTITGQTILSCKNETKMIGMPFYTGKLRRLQQPFFSGVFWLAEFFSGGFSVNAENIQLGG